MRRTAMLKRAGPYKVASSVDGVMHVTPAWPDFPPFDVKEGGGPGMFSRMRLAADLERFLNAPWAAGEPEGVEAR